MSSDLGRTAPAARRGPVRDPQGLLGGLAMLAFAAFAWWALGDLSTGTLRSMGPAMLPRILIGLVAACGLALVAASLRPARVVVAIGLVGMALAAFGRFFGFAAAIPVGLAGLILAAAGLTADKADGEPMERFTFRGPLFVALGIGAFAVTIRPFTFGPIELPGLGLLVAGPLAILIGGYATPEARFRDLLVMALALTPFCMVLFGDILNLAIPLFPQSLVAVFPDGWSQRQVLRATAAILAVAAAAIWFATRSREPHPDRIDVVDHKKEPHDRDRLSTADHLGG